MENNYGVILSDPPWLYNARTNPATRFCSGAGGHYPMLSTTEIANLKVPAAEDAVLFLWGTWPRLQDALFVMNSWGFTYRTVGFVWVKTNNNGGIWHGVGYYAKSNSEFCLLGTRGHPPKPATDKVSQMILAARSEHSRKPAEVRRRIELLYPSLTKLELFATEIAPGWDAIGMGIDGRDIRDVLG